MFGYVDIPIGRAEMAARNRATLAAPVIGRNAALALPAVGDQG